VVKDNKETMNFDDVILEKKTAKLLLLDIDDTILKAKGVFVYKNVNGIEVALSPEEFAKETVTPENKWMYDYRDFVDAEKMSRSIREATPILDVLRFMDHYISKGWLVGVLSARGVEDTVRDSLKGWLMYRKGSKLRNIGNKLKEVFAVGDKIRGYKGENIPERKANVIVDLSQKYDSIIFVDNDQNNVDLVKSLNLRNVKAINTDEILSNF
jgi:hypothetical protein